MNNIQIIVETANEAWESWFQRFMAKYHNDQMTQTSRDGAVIAEAINAITVIKDPTRNIITSPDRNMPMRYAIGELLWYLSGSDRVSDISTFSKAWERLSDDGETVNSAYGHRIFDKFGFNQWEYVKGLLQKDPNSRQAIIHIKDADHRVTKDLPCTICLHFLLRENRLNLTVYMRSNDIWLGFPYDVFSFTCLQIKMAMELGVGIGFYTHIAGSLHMYERNIPEKYRIDPKQVTMNNLSESVKGKLIGELIGAGIQKGITLTNENAQNIMQLEKELRDKGRFFGNAKDAATRINQNEKERFLSGQGYYRPNMTEG